MLSSQPRYSREEFARRGQEIYERDLRSRVEAAHGGEFIAIDIETGDYELDTDDFAATERLLTSKPGAQIWLLRVGQPAAYRVGGPRSRSHGGSA